MTGIAVVTGTSSGIGLHTAVALSQAGFTVIATMRNPGRCGPLREEAGTSGAALDVRPMDVQSGESVATCIQEVLRAYGRIDVLVNNAGSGFLGTMEETSEQDLREVMEVNFFGVWRVTQAVFAGMRDAAAGRIITVTSVGGLIGQPFNDAYCAAKFAVEGFMESLAPVALRLGVHVSLIEPGPVNTEFVAAVRGKLDRRRAAPEIYTPMLEAYLSGSREAFASIGQTAAEIARVIVEAATVASPRLRYPTSERMRDVIGRKYVDPTGDSILALSGARLPPIR